MLTKTNNPDLKVIAAKVTAADLLGTVLTHAKATHTAALLLCYAGAAFILRVNHFEDPKAKNTGFMSKQKAIDYLSEAILKQTDIKGNMLALYLRNSGTLAGILMGSLKRFSPVIQQLGEADTPTKMVGILSQWMNDNHAARIDSMGDLSEALGFKTSRPTPQKALTPALAGEKIGHAIKAIENAISKDKLDSAAEKSVAVQVAVNFQKPVMLAREAIKRVSDVDDLKSLVTVINDQIKTLGRLADAGVAAAKKAGKVHGKGEKRGQRTAVQQTTV